MANEWGKEKEVGEMRMKTIQVARATARLIARFLDVRLPMDVGVGFRSR
jgi:hypothetical protein